MKVAYLCLQSPGLFIIGCNCHVKIRNYLKLMISDPAIAKRASYIHVVVSVIQHNLLYGIMGFAKLMVMYSTNFW